MLVHTGQHFDDELSAVFFAELGLPAPDRELGISGGSNTSQTARMLAALEPVIAEEAPDAVLVYGDTNSTLAGALAALRRGCRWPTSRPGCARSTARCPRSSTGRLPITPSSLLLCSSQVAVENLRREGVGGDGRAGRRRDGRRRACDSSRARASAQRARRGARASSPGGYVLRRPTAPATSTIRRRLRAARRAAARRSAAGRAAAASPHPRRGCWPPACWTRSRLGERMIVDAAARLPRAHGAAVQRARAVLTDSGGLQKEAYLAGRAVRHAAAEHRVGRDRRAGWNVLVDLDRERGARGARSEPPPRAPAAVRRRACRRARASPRLHCTSARDGVSTDPRSASPGSATGARTWRATSPRCPACELAWCCDASADARERRRPAVPGRARDGAPRRAARRSASSTRSCSPRRCRPTPSWRCGCSRPASTASSRSRWRSRSPTPSARVAAARAGGRLLMVGHLLEYHPGVAEAQGARRRRRARRADLLHLRQPPEPRQAAGGRERALEPRRARRVGACCTSPARSRSEAVAHGESYVREGVEDVVFCFLRFPSGLSAHLHLSWLDPHKERRFTVVGSQPDGDLRRHGARGQAHGLRQGLRRGRARLRRVHHPRRRDLLPADRRTSSRCGSSASTSSSASVAGERRAPTAPAACAWCACSSSCKRSLDASEPRPRRRLTPVDGRDELGSAGAYVGERRARRRRARPGAVIDAERGSAPARSAPARHPRRHRSATVA